MPLIFKYGYVKHR